MWQICAPQTTCSNLGVFLVKEISSQLKKSFESCHRWEKAKQKVRWGNCMLTNVRADFSAGPHYHHCSACNLLAANFFPFQRGNIVQRGYHYHIFEYQCQFCCLFWWHRHMHDSSTNVVCIRILRDKSVVRWTWF